MLNQNITPIYILVKNLRIVVTLFISFVLLCVNLCDPSWLKDLFLPLRDTKDITKVLKGIEVRSSYYNQIKY